MDEPVIDVPLADLIAAVRGELEQAAHEAKGRDLLFEVKDVELDVEIATTRTREASGGLKVWVVSIGGKGARSTASTNRVKLSLGAVTKDRRSYLTSDDSGGPMSDK